MDRLRRNQHDETATIASLTDPGRLAAAVGAGAGGIEVISGPFTERVQAANMTVGEIFRLLRVPFNIAPQAAAIVNGDLATPDRRLADGDTLEFARRAGEKGSASDARRATEEAEETEERRAR